MAIKTAKKPQNPSKPNLLKQRVIVLEPEEKIFNTSPKIPLIVYIAVALVIGSLTAVIWGDKSEKPKNHYVTTLVSNTPRFSVELTQGVAEIQTDLKTPWALVKNQESYPMNHSKLRTDAVGLIDFKMGSQAFLRLKPNSVLSFQYNDESKTLRAHLESGELLGYTQKTKNLFRFIISNPKTSFEASENRFVINYDNQKNKSVVSQLSGELLVNENSQKISKLISHQKIDSDESKPASLTDQDWNKYKEVLSLKLPEITTRQSNALKVQDIGKLFNYVESYRPFQAAPILGFAESEIVSDIETHHPILKINYDLFPKRSVSGISFQLKSKKLSAIQSLSMEVRKSSKQPSPQMMTVQIKSSNNIIQKYHLKNFRDEWYPVLLPVDFPSSEQFFEINFLFARNHIGKETQGALEFRNIHLNSTQESADIAHNSKENKTPVHEEKKRDLSDTDELDELVTKLQNLNQILKQTSLKEIKTAATNDVKPHEI